MPAPVNLYFHERRAPRGDSRRSVGSRRFLGVTGYLRRITNLPLVTSFTIMAWVKISVDRNAFSTFFARGNNNGNSYIIQTTSDGTTLTAFNSATSVNGSALTVGRWYHLAATVAGTGVGQYLVYLDGNLDITANGSAAVTSTHVIFGAWGTTPDDPLNGCVAAVKVYTFPLSRMQIQREMPYVAPVLQDRLNTWLPFIGGPGANICDYSGNRFTMASFGTPLYEPGPPIEWAPKTLRSRARVVTVSQQPSEWLPSFTQKTYQRRVVAF